MSYGLKYLGKPATVAAKVAAFTANLPPEEEAQLNAAKASIAKALADMPEGVLVSAEAAGSAWSGACSHTVKVERLDPGDWTGTPPPTGGGPGDPHS